MSQFPRAYIYIEKGPPFASGIRVPLEYDQLYIGRDIPDNLGISFTSPAVSRRHLLITWQDGAFHAQDKGSKNGTWINGNNLDYFVAYKLKDGDRIDIGKNTVTLRFSYTRDLSTVTQANESDSIQITFDEDRRELVIEGQKIVLRGHLYTIFALLYRNSGKAMSHLEIKQAVWPDRAKDDRGEPLAMEGEIHRIISRLRHKLGKHHFLINNIRGYGYIFDG